MAVSVATTFFYSLLLLLRHMLVFPMEMGTNIADFFCAKGPHFLLTHLQWRKENFTAFICAAAEESRSSNEIRWLEEQKKLAGVTSESPVYLSLRLDGRVRGSGVGYPPWNALVAQLPPVKGMWTGLLDGFDGRV